MKDITKTPSIPRGKITKLIRTLTYDLDGPLEEAVARLLAVRNAYPEYVELRVSFDRDEGLEVYGTRDETDAEWAERAARDINLKRIRVAQLEAALAAAKKELEE